jgi:hypothetical protein
MRSWTSSFESRECEVGEVRCAWSRQRNGVAASGDEPIENTLE